MGWTKGRGERDSEESGEKGRDEGTFGRFPAISTGYPAIIIFDPKNKESPVKNFQIYSIGYIIYISVQKNIRSMVESSDLDS
jgi:hypothetical protein